MQESGGYREIWVLSWPVMLAQVLVSAVSLVDIAMVGRLGPHAVAAVGYAGIADLDPTAVAKRLGDEGLAELAHVSRISA